MGKGTWATADVPEMWISAQAADTNMAWEQVGAWSRTYELLSYHEGRLRALQNQLSTAWPPSRSPAAAAFVSHIDGLLTKIGQARQDAASNRDALKLLLEALASAKKDMAPLKAKWDRYQAEYPQRSQSPSGLMGHGGGPSWQQDLNSEARARMTRSDGEVFEVTQRFVAPHVGGSPSGGGEDPGNAPPTETIRNHEMRSSSLTETSEAHSNGSSTLPGVGESQLAGTTVVTPPSLTSVPPVGSQLPAGAEAASGRVPPPFASTPGVVPIPGNVRQTVEPSRLPGGVGARSLSTSNAPGMSSSTGVGGQRVGSRVNPVGGVISSAPAGGVGLPLARSGGAAGSDDGTRIPVAMLQWEAPQGGVPVIEPPVDRPFDLGPGVIGIDR